MAERSDGANGVVLVHVLLPASILRHSPSLQDGVRASVEREHRFFGCELIQEAGVLLRLPQVVMATAQTMLHRFYYRKSLRDFDAFRVALACVFLAAKVEERPKRIKDVLSVFYALYRRRRAGKTRANQQLLDLESGTYCLWRDWLVMVERQVLIDLGFSVYNVMEHPHKYILYYIKIVGGSQELAQKAWGFINDSLRIDLCVRYKAEVIACAAIFLASRFLQVHLPENPPWYSLFDVEKQALYDVSIELVGLYSRERVQWLDPLTEVNPFADDNGADVDEHGDAEVDSEVSMQVRSATEEQQQQTVNVVAGKQSPGTTRKDGSPRGADESARLRELVSEKPLAANPLQQSQDQGVEKTHGRVDNPEAASEASSLKPRSGQTDLRAEKQIGAAEVGAKSDVGLETPAALAAAETKKDDEAAAPAAVRVAVARPRGGDGVEAEVEVAVDDVTTKSTTRTHKVTTNTELCSRTIILTAIEVCLSLHTRKNKQESKMDDEDAYEAALIDEFDAPCALSQTPARVPPAVRQPPPQPAGCSSADAGARVAAANASALYSHMLPTEPRDRAPQYALSGGHGAVGGASLYPRFGGGSRSVLTGAAPMTRQHSSYAYPGIHDSSFAVKEGRNVRTALHGAPVSAVASGRDSEAQVPQQPGRSCNPVATASNADLPGEVGICAVGGVPLTKQHSYPVIDRSCSVQRQHDALGVQGAVAPTDNAGRCENDADRPQPRRPDQLEVPTYPGHAPSTVPVRPELNGSKPIEYAAPVNWRDDERAPRRPDQPVNPSGHQSGDRATRTDPAQPEVNEEMSPGLSDQEFKAQQREIVRELAGYQHQLNYIAHALAGDTPHQREERKRRELERQERDHQRAVAMEHRVQLQIDRAHERDERRAKVLSRANRASRSPSPEPNEAQECTT